MLSQNNQVELAQESVISLGAQNQEQQQNNFDKGVTPVEIQQQPQVLEEISQKGQDIQHPEPNDKKLIAPLLQEQLIPVNNESENLTVQECLELQLERWKKIEAQTNIPKEKKILRQVISTLETQLEKLKYQIIEPITNDVSNFGGISLIKELEQSEESFYIPSMIQKHLKEIYKFYSKIFYVRGPSDDFSRINHESQTLTEGKFIIFCRQFGLIDEKIHHIKTQSKSIETNRILNDTPFTKLHKVPQSTRNGAQINHQILTFKEINQLFRKVNQNKNEITFPVFVQVIQELAKSMFKDSKAELQLFQLMEVDTQQFKKKMKSLNVPFCSKDESGFRKPEGLQQFKNYNQSTDELKSKRQLIENWKNQKKSELREKLQINQDQSRSKSIMFEPSYTKTRNYKERKLRKIGLDANQHSVVNWEKLDGIDPKLLLQEDFKPEDLIDEDEDDDKFYLKSYDLSKANLSSQHKISTRTSHQRTQGTKLKSESRIQIQNFSSIETINGRQSAYLKLPKLNKK